MNDSLDNPMTEPVVPPEPPRLYKRVPWQKLSLEHVFKTSAMVAAGLYMLGLLVANDYLARIGVTDFSVIRVRYILTGAEVIVLPLAILATLMLTCLVIFNLGYHEDIAKLLDRVKPFFEKHSSKTKDVWSLLGLLAALGLMTALLFDYPSETYKQMAIFPVALALTATGALLFSKELRRKKREYRARKTLQAALAMYLLAGMVAVVSWVHLWALYAFPSIPVQFGGGEPREIQIVIDLERVSSLSTAFRLSFDPSGLSEPVDLLWETTDYFVLRHLDDLGTDAFLIDRDLVIAVINGKVEEPTEPNNFPLVSSPEANQESNP